MLNRIIKYTRKVLNLLIKKEYGISIVLYHNIGGFPVPGAVSVKSFEKQLRFMQNHSSIISINDAIELLTLGEKLNKNYTVISFDDGTKEFCSETIKILERYNIPAIQYIPTGWIGKKMPSLSHKFEYEIMNDDEIIEISKHPLITIGSHSVIHERLTELESSQQFSEVYNSKKYLEELLGYEIEHFSYPKGKYDKQVIEQLEKTKYKYATTCDYGLNYPNSNLLLLKRLWIYKKTNLIMLYLFIKGC